LGRLRILDPIAETPFEGMYPKEKWIVLQNVSIMNKTLGVKRQRRGIFSGLGCNTERKKKI
jgi:hypothetical protein